MVRTLLGTNTLPNFWAPRAYAFVTWSVLATVTGAAYGQPSSAGAATGSPAPVAATPVAPSTTVPTTAFQTAAEPIPSAAPAATATPNSAATPPPGSPPMGSASATTSPAVTPSPQPAPVEISSAPLAAGSPAVATTRASAPTAIAQPAAAAPSTAEPAEPDVVPPRADRPFALTGSLGWNSLAGFAIGVTYSFDPHISADLAFGIGTVGAKTGARLRYNLFEGSWTPTFGLGIQYGPGSGRAIEFQGANQDEQAELLIEPSAFAQGLAAMSYQGQGGFTALFGVGYSVLLDKDNVRTISGSEETADAMRFVTGSGIVLEIGLGYAF